MTQHHTTVSTSFDPVSGLAAVAFPGAGHIAAGQTMRGLHISAGVLGLFFGGLLIGGIDIVDRRENFWWFVAQGLTGPLAFGIDYVHQNHYKVQVHPNSPIRVTPPPGPGQTVVKAIGKPSELGTLFTAIAGMVNLIVIIDAAFPTRRRGSNA